MDNPTQEQIKEFWEWCGKSTYWTYENGWENYPKITLNNLFEYAVPKVVSTDLQTWDNEPHATLATVYSHGNNPISVWDKDPALALFWALWQVKEVKE